MKKHSLLFFFFALTLCAAAQKDSLRKKKLTFFAGWGYNREAYTTSTIHFVNNGTGGKEYGPYNFEIIDAKAKDKSDFDAIKDVINITIPQFSCRFGIWLNNNNDEGFEINYDHAKYVVTDGQNVHFKGTINGVPVDKDSVLNRNFFHFEHTDGANFWQLNYMKRNRIWYSRKKIYRLSYVFKPGAGVVIPRTDVTLFGHRLNNNWKVAGVMASLEVAIRNDIGKHFFIELSGKSGWCDYINCFVLGKGNGRAYHNFGFVSSILIAGYQF
jgi:hypothetical protein